MAFVPSKYQKALFDFIQGGQGNAVVEAVAGSGKTTSLLQSLSYIPTSKSTIFLAFNKDIATVLAERVREQGSTGVEVMTLNALGNRAWARFKNVSRNNVEAKKLDLIAREYRDELAHKTGQTFSEDDMGLSTYVRQFLQGIVNLVRKAKVSGLAPAGVPGITGLVEDTVEEWEKIIDHYGFEISDSHREDGHAIKAAQAILKRSVLSQETIDFDDQFYLPLLYNVPFTKYDWVFIDECQDVSDIQRKILHRIMHATSRLIAVGDKNQAIYSFRGANPESLDLIADEFHAIRLPLSISYRCAQKVVEFAKEIVPHIEASETAQEGSVTEMGSKFSPSTFRQDDMILCRNNAPLVSLAYELISAHIPCLVKGRNIGQGLIKLVDKMKVVTLSALANKLETWMTKEVARLRKKDEDADISGVVDKYDSIVAFMDGSKAKDVEGLKAEIKSMFKLYDESYKNEYDDKTPENVLTLSSVHKAKGLEAPRVFILNYFLMPSKWAKKSWEQIQEKNIQYVAITRAKRDLVFIERRKKTSGGYGSSEMGQ